MIMDINEIMRQQNRDWQRKIEEDKRNEKQVEAIRQLGFEHMRNNSLIENQCKELKEQNKILKDSLEQSRKSEKFSKAISIITACTAILSLIAMIFIAIFD